VLRDEDRGGLPASFTRLLTASGFSNLADGVLAVVVPLVAIRATRSPTVIAGISVAASLPWLLVPLLAGAIVDRVDRRRLLITAGFARAAVALGLVGALLLLDVVGIGLLYAVAFLLGVIETFADTTAQTVLPRLVAPTQLTRANSRLYAVELAANQFVGPPLGGALIAAGAAVALAAPGLLWGAGALLLLRLPSTLSAPAATERASMRTDIAEGMRFLAGHRVLRRLAIMTGGGNLAVSAAFSVFVLYAVGPESTLGLDEPAFGLLLTASAVGSLVGSLVARRLERRLGRRRMLALAVPSSALLVLTPALTRDARVVAAGLVVGGVAVVLWNVVAVSLRQGIVPDRLLGRVNSSYRLLAWGTRPLGALAGGVVAEAFGLRSLFLIAGGLSLALVGLLTGLTEQDLTAPTDRVP